MQFEIREQELDIIRRLKESGEYLGKVYDSTHSIRDIVESLLGTSVSHIVVDFIRKNGRIVCGSTRFPLLVKCSDGSKFVVKPYAGYNPIEVERNVLTTVSGRIHPMIKNYSIGYYAEEYLPSDTSYSLESRLFTDATSSSKEVIERSAYAYAFLARLGINYNDRHFLDEIHVSGENIIMTDFGNARPFEARGSSDGKRLSYDWCLSLLEKEGFLKLFSGIHNPISISFNPLISSYDVVVRNLKRISNPELQMNIIRVFGDVYKSISNTAEFKNPEETFERFVDAFTDFYLNETFPYSISHSDIPLARA